MGIGYQPVPTRRFGLASRERARLVHAWSSAATSGQLGATLSMGAQTISFGGEESLYARPHPRDRDSNRPERAIGTTGRCADGPTSLCSRLQLSAFVATSGGGSDVSSRR